ncbi:type I-C CRISPR-associated protein Cas5c [Pseudorhodoferax sp.]|uniref:type I-C CRISPR-associated protein Cas5c n=1 Tax=Pseudorhodoferax sp. TaxID=1993553 RepID=UPI0039E59ABD
MKRFCLEVTGDFACFTRPEMKVERVSYDVITPSAARAVFESIFWKPSIRWHVRRIEVLAPVRWVNLRRNEVKSKVSVSSVVSAMQGGDADVGIYADEPDERVQRAALFLRDVAYRLHADMEVCADRSDPAPEAKFHTMFERRALAGQCVNQPYLGCREFAARVRLVTDISAEPAPIDDSRDLGWMLHDMDFANPSDPQPVFFRAQMRRGAIEVGAGGVAR